MILIYDACSMQSLYQASDEADIGAAIDCAVHSFALGDPRYLFAVRVDQERGLIHDRMHGEVLWMGVAAAPGPMRPFEIHLHKTAA